MPAVAVKQKAQANKKNYIKHIIKHNWVKSSNSVPHIRQHKTNYDLKQGLDTLLFITHTI